MPFQSVVPRVGVAVAERRSLFLYSPVGGGHASASCALENEWQALNPDWRSDRLDYLQFMPAWERRLWPGLYLWSLRHCPSLWRRYRNWTNRPSEPSLIRDRVTHVGLDAFVDALRLIRPQLVVSTIGGAAALAGAARERLGISFLNALVVTGFRAHRHWARPEADLIFVASESARTDLLTHGIPAERVSVVGTPIRSGLRPLGPSEKTRLRASLGLGANPVVLVSSGATGAYRSFDDLLRTLARIDQPIDIVTFKGSQSLPRQVGRARILRLGFREDFCDWLSASDLVIGKLGGLTAAEACAAGVPVVVFEPIPGQEEANAEELVASGAAAWPRTHGVLRDVVAHLLSPRGQLDRERMAHAALQFGRPDAGPRIARLLRDALEART